MYRAPKIMLEPLSFTAVRKHYMDIFELDQREADKNGSSYKRDILLHSRYWDIFTGKTGMITR